MGLSDPELPFTADNESIRIFRHALSLDEHRVKFMPNFYHVYSSAKDTVHHHERLRPKDCVDDQEKSNPHTQEVWFAGCHSGKSIEFQFINRNESHIKSY